MSGSLQTRRIKKTLITLSVLIAMLACKSVVAQDYIDPGYGDHVPKKIILLDPGHGGRDAGTKSPATGAEEKDITLAFSKLLKLKLEETGEYIVVMTRDSDSFVSLEKRVRFARGSHADILISIHADAGYDRSVRGTTIYITSGLGSRKRLNNVPGDFENDVSGGLEYDSGSIVDGILRDFILRETKILSHHLAGCLFKTLSSTEGIKLRGGNYVSADFQVLSAPDVPSVLIELGFLSNLKDEALLLSPAWRERTIEAVITAIEKFFRTGCDSSCDVSW